MEILGVKIDNVSFQEALEKIKKILGGGGKHYIVTPNPEIMMLAQQSGEFKKILNEADLSIPDGIGIVWGAKVLGKSLKERVTGVDLLKGLAALGEEHGYNLFLLGGREGAAEITAKVLKIKYPKINIIGIYEGEADPEYDSYFRKQLKDKKIDILAVAYGAPKQEKWIARNLPYLNVKLAIGLGGAFDLLSGKQKRAPVAVQKIGLEWLFRLIQQPSRWKRQLSLPQFAWLIFKKRIQRK